MQDTPEQRKRHSTTHTQTGGTLRHGFTQTDKYTRSVATQTATAAIPTAPTTESPQRRASTPILPLHNPGTLDGIARHCHHILDADRAAQFLQFSGQDGVNYLEHTIGIPAHATRAWLREWNASFARLCQLSTDSIIRALYEPGFQDRLREHRDSAHIAWTDYEV